MKISLGWYLFTLVKGPSDEEWHLPELNEPTRAACGVEVDWVTHDEAPLSTTRRKCGACLAKRGFRFYSQADLEVTSDPTVDVDPTCSCQGAVSADCQGRGIRTTCMVCGASRFVSVVLPRELDPNHCN